MPAKVRKNKDGTFRVVTPEGVRAKSTTKAKAERQAALLNGLASGSIKPKDIKRKRAPRVKGATFE